MIVMMKKAETMACPMTHSDPNNTMKCLGCECMAWRWADEGPGMKTYVANDLKAQTEPPRPERVPASWAWSPYDGGDEPACWVEDVESWKSRRTGYCGLAGVPQGGR
jgi:hypothetical protein